MDELILRRLGLTQEQLDEFWVNGISSVASLILDAFDIPVPLEMESEGIRFFPGYTTASTDRQEVAVKPAKLQPPRLLAHLPSQR